MRREVTEASNGFHGNGIRCISSAKENGKNIDRENLLILYWTVSQTQIYTQKIYINKERKKKVNKKIR